MIYFWNTYIEIQYIDTSLHMKKNMIFTSGVIFTLLNALIFHCSNVKGNNNDNDVLIEMNKLANFSCGVGGIDNQYGYSHNHHKHLDKTSLMFAFNQEAGKPYSYIEMPAVVARGVSPALVKALCNYIGACCSILSVPQKNCWDTSLFPGFSPGLNSDIYDYCADIELLRQKKLGYDFSSLPYWKGNKKLRMMIRKDSPTLASWWDAALCIFVCSTEYQKFCTKLDGKGGCLTDLDDYCD